MRVFVTGATGFIGSAVVRELIAGGHTVTGLARNAAAAKALKAKGAGAHRGTLTDLKSLRRGAAAADGVIHLAFVHDISHMTLRQRLRIFAGGAPTGIAGRFMAVITEADRAAIDALGAALEGSGRPLVTTFGTLAMKQGRLANEADAVDPKSMGHGRAVTEGAVRAWAQRGVRAIVVRLPPSVHGEGDAGFVPRLISAARKARLSAYAGQGANRWPAVHRLDAARLFRLALENGKAGAAYHGVAEEGVPFRDIAEAIGRGLNVPAASKPQKWIAKRLSWIAPFVDNDNPTSSAHTQAELNWRPEHPTLLADLEGAGYFDA